MAQFLTNEYVLLDDITVGTLNDFIMGKMTEGVKRMVYKGYINAKGRMVENYDRRTMSANDSEELLGVLKSMFDELVLKI